MTNQTTLPTFPLTLQDAWTIWLQQPKQGDPTITNAGRSPSDRANYKRALLDFSLGVMGAADLAQVPLARFALEIEVVLQTVTDGARKRYGGQPSPRQLTMLHSWTRRLRDDLSDCLTLPDVAPASGRQLRKALTRNRYLPPFRFTSWPEGLPEEFGQLAQAYTDDLYAGPGREYFGEHLIRPQSVAGYRKALHQLVRFCLEDEGLSSPGLGELVDMDRVLRYREWYLSAVHQGGYRQFDMTCQALANVARYLVASGHQTCEYALDSEASAAPWIRFYRLGRATMKIGVQRGALTQLEELPVLTTRELREIARQARNTQPRTSRGRQPTGYSRYVRDRTAMI